jgi:hypothetical protein
VILSYLLCSDLRFDYGFCIIYVRALAKGELTDSDGRKIGKFLTQQAATTTKKIVNRHMQFAACTVTVHVANS